MKTGSFLTVLLLLAAGGAAAQDSGRSAQARFDRLIVKHARRNDLDPRLVKAVILVESGFAPHARSCKGARGLMQVMRETARDMGVRDRDLYEPDANIRAGTDYLHWLFVQVRSEYGLSASQLADAPAWATRRVLAAYNGGTQLLYRDLWPRDTRFYVRRVLMIRGTNRSALAPGPDPQSLKLLASLGYQPPPPRERW